MNTQSTMNQPGGTTQQDQAAQSPASAGKSPFFFGGNTMPQQYDDYLGPFVFEPFALDLANRVAVADGGQVLELACGTGRVTSHLAAKLPHSAHLLATDINPDMLAVARQKTTAPNVSWAPMDMRDIPADENHFDLIVCQFGLMFVPDKLQTLCEMRRVLKPGGRLLFNTWGPIANNPVWRINATTLTTLLGTTGVTLEQGPFSMQDERAVLCLLEQASFAHSEATAVQLVGESETAATATRGSIHGAPTRLIIRQNAPDRLADIEQTLENTLIAELGDKPLRSPLHAWVFAATK